MKIFKFIKSMKFIGACLLFSTASTTFSQTNIINDTTILLQQNEVWWGGAVNDGSQMPFGKIDYTFSMYGDSSNNQTAPLLISNKGRWIWSEAPFQFTFRNGDLILSAAKGIIEYGKNGNTLKEAYSYMSKLKFPSSGLWPDSLLITAPQYNLWIELLYNPNQKDVMDYAHHILNYKMPPGVLMIDDNWSTGYGSFDFDFKKFPDAALMTDSLHSMGFKVMLWVCPFITADGVSFRELRDKKLLLMDNEGDSSKTWANASKPLLVRWWNGYSACLDLSNPETLNWLKNKLSFLQTQYGIDGFKFDAGDPNFYDSPNLVTYKQLHPNDQSMLWSKIGLEYKLNEYRASWKMAGQPLVQRLLDKGHNWEDIKLLIPNTIAQHLLGYTFTCPDMIGGGDFVSFLKGSVIDQDLIVRSAQVHALMPMMQFSVAPWRILDSLHLQAVLKSVALRQQYLPYLMEVITKSVKSGQPVIKALEYDFPNQQLENIKDQFMLGAKYMVAPILTKSTIRSVIFPSGKWKYKNQIIKGSTKKEFNVSLDELLVFERL